MKSLGTALFQWLPDGDEAPPLPPEGQQRFPMVLHLHWSLPNFAAPAPGRSEGGGRARIWLCSHSSSHVTFRPSRIHSGHLSWAWGQQSIV